MATDALARLQYVRRGITLEYLTIGWNLLECLVAVAAGYLAGSVALIGFGVDSSIESVSSSILLWRLHAERGESKLRRLNAPRWMVGVSFFLLAYVAPNQQHPDPSQEPSGCHWNRAGDCLPDCHAAVSLGQARTAANLNSALCKRFSADFTLCLPVSDY
jgi:hypothetical protein